MGFSLLLRSYDPCLYFVSQEVWKVSTTSGSRRVRKGSFAEAAALLSTSDLSQVNFTFCYSYIHIISSNLHNCFLKMISGVKESKPEVKHDPWFRARTEKNILF